MAGIIVVTDDTFDEIVLANLKPMILDFWAPWAQECRLLAPEIEKLALAYDGFVDVGKVEVDANPTICAMFEISQIPTTLFFAPGSTPVGIVGVQSSASLESRFGLAAYGFAPAVADGAPTLAASEQDDALAQIRVLGELRDAKVISDDEFAAKKRELLERV